MSKLTSLAAAAVLLSVTALGSPVLAQIIPMTAGEEADEAEFDAAMSLLETDPEAGLARIRSLADAGSPWALTALGAILVQGPDADPVEAEQAWRRAIALDQDAARLNLATHILVGSIKGDYAEAVSLLQAITDEAITPYVSYPLGRAYLFGHGVPQDMARGSTLMIEAAAAAPENLDARFLAGRALMNGWGIPADPAAAREHLRYAADRGDDRAQWNLGMLLLEGQGGAADPVEARRYVQMSAESGYYQGQISMAVMLALGQGGPVDAPAARDWYGRAAMQGSAHAMRGLGMMLITGEGGAADPVTGWALLELAAEAGEEPAAKLMDLLLEQGFKPDLPAVGEARQQVLAITGEPWL